MAAKVLGEEEKPMLDFEETELRLGLPGGGGRVKADHDTNSINMAENKININGKRDFSETVDLKLNLSSKQMELNPTDNNIKTTNNVNKNSVKPPAAKAQVVGWPPVRSFRKNILAASQKNSGAENQESENKQATVVNGGAAAFVKVSMDGAPYLRKVDLNMYKSYQQLSDALAKMFSSFTIGNCEVQGMKDFMNKSKLMDLLNSSDYVPTYEDKDGDWMLVGDVPWEMFVESCKRLSIMRGTEAIGLGKEELQQY